MLFLPLFLLGPAIIEDPAATSKDPQRRSSGMEQVAPVEGNRTRIDTPLQPRDRAQVQIQTEPRMAGAARPSVNVAAPPAPAPAKGQSAILAQAMGAKPCQDPDILACTGEELQELKQQLSAEQSLTTPSLDVSRVANDPAKAIDVKSIDPITARVILMP